MLRRYRFALRPGWLALHVVTVALVVTMTLLGHWQLDVSNSKHFNIRNFGYALQWWAFSLFTLLMWFRIMRDRVKHADDPDIAAVSAPTEPERPVGYRRYVPPPPAEPQDELHAAYNDYLARLHRETP